MNVDKQAWLDALRSGDYKQNYCYLKSEDGYCCLGVACDLKGGSWVIDTEKEDAYDFVYDGKVYKSSMNNSFLGDFLGLDSKGMSTLVNMNDSEECNFNEIADWIEENL